MKSDLSVAAPGRRRSPWLAEGAILLAALGLLSIGLTDDWRLLHEDNGAFYTSLALSHLRLGLADTRAHDVFFNPATGERQVYGHHPPGLALLLSTAFAAARSDAPAVARGVAIAFHLGSLVLLLALLRELVARPWAILGGVLFVVLPMSAYFGRMVGYEPLGLFSVLLQLLGWSRFRREGRRGNIAMLATGVVLGGLIDWAPLFFSVALGIVEAMDLVRGRTTSKAPLAALAVAALAVALLDLVHLRFAAGFDSLRDVMSLNGNRLFRGGGPAPLDFILGQIDGYRRYFTLTGLLAAAVVAPSLLRPRSRLATALFRSDAVLKRLLVASGAAGLGYLLAAPAWADAHAYWKFYFLPFAILSMVLLARALAARSSLRFSRAHALLAFGLIEVLATSTYMLWLRHTRTSAYAVAETARIRHDFLRPSHLPAAP